MKSWEVAVRECLRTGTLIAGVLSQARGRGGVRKIELKPVTVQGGPHLQFESFEGRKTTHRNVPASDAPAEVIRLLKDVFRQAHFFTGAEDVQVHMSARDQAAVRRGPATRTPGPTAHNRPKDRWIPEGVPCDFLIRLGVMNASGKVLASGQHKFRQINRFVELVADVADRIETPGPLRVVDFGCGKSYLTFALHHYLVQLRQRDVRILGLDLKEDVVAECSRIARETGAAGLEFKVGDLSALDPRQPVDLVVMLHACDTATDEGLAHAIRGRARAIFTVPCCHHEAAGQIEAEAQAPLLRHGIIRERLAALISDAARAAILEREGYEVQVLEFVDVEHTAKNLLIRAVRRTGSPAPRPDRFGTFRDYWGLTPRLEALLTGAPPA